VGVSTVRQNDADPVAVARSGSPAGTIGYMAPEYVKDGLVSPKLDVYSFGIVMLEMLANRVAICFKVSRTERHLSSWLRSYLDDVVELDEVLGGILLPSWPREHLERFCSLAKECTSKDPQDRPTMHEVALRLSLLSNDEQEDIQLPVDWSDSAIDK